MSQVTQERIVEACARAAHEVNRAYCIAIGDTSQPRWENAPDWQRQSARNGVGAALRGATAEESHESWLREKLYQGWTYGPVKDPVAKTHPCIRPYAELPPDQQNKDALFLSTVRAVAVALGMPAGAVFGRKMEVGAGGGIPVPQVRITMDPGKNPESAADTLVRYTQAELEKIQKNGGDL